jgi:hypothetical protein
MPDSSASGGLSSVVDRQPTASHTIPTHIIGRSRCRTGCPTRCRCTPETRTRGQPSQACPPRERGKHHSQLEHHLPRFNGHRPRTTGIRTAATVPPSALSGKRLGGPSGRSGTYRIGVERPFGRIPSPLAVMVFLRRERQYPFSPEPPPDPAPPASASVIALAEATPCALRAFSVDSVTPRRVARHQRRSPTTWSAGPEELKCATSKGPSPVRSPGPADAHSIFPPRVTGAPPRRAPLACGQTATR